MQFCSRYKQEDILLCSCQPTNTRYRHFSLKDACIAANLRKKMQTVIGATNINTILFDIGLKFEEETSEMLRLEHGSVWC